MKDLNGKPVRFKKKKKEKEIDLNNDEDVYNELCCELFDHYERKNIDAITKSIKNALEKIKSKVVPSL